MTGRNILEIRDLSIAFRTERGDVHALREITLDVPEGSITGIVGESGSGKSTLSLAIMRLLPPTADVRGGSIVMNGRDLSRLSEAEMRDLRGRRLSMVFQDPMTSLNPVLSIGRQMVDIQYRDPGGAGDKWRRAAEMLARVGVSDAPHRLRGYPHQLSGGMRQRVAIAMALLCRPDLLIADEATTALDVTMEAQIVHLLRILRAEVGASILFISHNLGLIAELCDQVAIFYAGELVEHGTVEDIFHRPMHPYTRALLDCDPVRLSIGTHDLPTIPGEVPNLRCVPAGCVFAPRCAFAMPVCSAARPAEQRIGASHRVRCHLHQTDSQDGERMCLAAGTAGGCP